MADRFLLSGEFHYFRVERARWARALELARQAGLDTVSIYVPWNWHQPAPGPGGLDMAGATSPERDLFGALDAIAAAGLRCVLRPGPFITAEWRNGGIPDWLLEGHPEIHALDHTGRPAGHAYPAITYAHPAYQEHAAAWLRAVIHATRGRGYLGGGDPGGPVVSLQLDDEPSYWQQLAHPLAVDYNPLLVTPGAAPSAYGRWLLERYGDLAAVGAAHGTAYRAAAELAPPRAAMRALAELPSFLDWLDFKLDQINQHVAFLYQVVREAGIELPLSMLHPYLLPLSAAKFADFARKHRLDLQLTNECYLSLFAATATAEQKIGAVLACHETYRMWCGPTQGPPVTMELQGSNATFLTPASMELLYALTVARGIKGINWYMLVGGANPPGFEGLTGSEYDIDAPISADGRVRPHYRTIAKLTRIVRAAEAEIAAAEPLRDVWLGCYGPYERAALSAADAVLDVRAITETFNYGDIGQSDAGSLAVLLALTGVSFGCTDLERAAPASAALPWTASLRSPARSDGGLAAAAQLWAPGVAFMDERTQHALSGYVAGGGHLVLLPGVPALDEHARPCTLLQDFIWDGANPSANPFPSLGGPPEVSLSTSEGPASGLSTGPGPLGGSGGTVPRPEAPPANPMAAAGPPDGSGWGYTIVRTADGETLVAPGAVTRFRELPPGATPIAWPAVGEGSDIGAPCGFTCQRGDGTVTVLGFRLQYMPTAGPGQRAFTRRLAESACGTLAATTSGDQFVASQLSGPDGGLLCVANVAELAGGVRVTLTRPGAAGPERATVPVVLEELRFAGRGARLLPLGLRLPGPGGGPGGGGLVLRHATWELVGRARDEHAGTARLGFVATPGEAGEIVLDRLEADPGSVEAAVAVGGGVVTDRQRLHDGGHAVIVRADAAEVWLTVGDPGPGGR